MKVIHTSDWHLGQYFYGKSRAKEHQAFLNWLLSQVEQQSIDAIIVAGDIFDTGTPPSYAREMYFNFVVALHKLGCQLVVLAGNHDSVVMLTEAKNVLKPLGCHVISQVNQNEDELVFHLLDKQGQPAAVICAVPFIRPRDITVSKAGQSADDKNQALQQAISERYQVLYQRAQQLAQANEQQKTLPIIGTGHLTVVGAKTSDSVRDIYIGTLEAYASNLFPDFDYLALGHIHQSQKIAQTEHIRYSGSPIPLSFDEVKQAKKVLVVEFSDERLQQVTELTIPRFQPMAMVKTSLQDIIIDVRAALEQLADKVVEQSKSSVWLDIELTTSDYLTGLQNKLTEILADFPVEILLVRRTKKARTSMQIQQDKLVLAELSLSDVFESRLAQQNWENESALQQKQRLTELFEQTTEQVKQTNEPTTEAQS